MKKVTTFCRKFILFFIGMSIIQFGVALFLQTNIGSDPFTVFTQGLAVMLNKTGLKDLSIIDQISSRNGITTGMANLTILTVLLIVIIMFERKRINIGTLICVVGVGPIIDISVKAVSYLNVSSYNLVFKILFVGLGCFIIAIGFSVLSATNIGVAPNDIIPFIIQDKTKMQYRTIRITMDAVLLVAGFLLGGTIGIGTVIAMLLIGPFIQFCLPIGQKINNINFNFLKSENIQKTINA
jgi:uncharacterized membrane protein YczE